MRWSNQCVCVILDTNSQIPRHYMGQCWCHRKLQDINPPPPPPPHPHPHPTTPPPPHHPTPTPTPPPHHPPPPNQHPPHPTNTSSNPIFWIVWGNTQEQRTSLFTCFRRVEPKLKLYTNSIFVDDCEKLSSKIIKYQDQAILYIH